MVCVYAEKCGGCTLRHLQYDEYKHFKNEEFRKVISKIRQSGLQAEEAVFIPDGLRRRAEFSFCCHKNKLQMGFNSAKSHEISDIDYCCSLTEKINRNLLQIKSFLQNLCNIKIHTKIKNKLQTTYLKQGKIFITQAANGLDILLETDQPFNLDHRLETADFLQKNPDIIRISLKPSDKIAETIVEKDKPYTDICGYRVFIPAGTFLQASDEAQNALIELVKSYIGNTEGKIADLFCGVGTFSYPLSANPKNKITAADSSADLLTEFQKTINTLTIPNIKIIKKNLFKYPFDSDELKGFDVIVFDPPRAGAAAQIKQISLMNKADKPQKIVAISCNPHTFVNDANTLIDADYKLTKITMIDQFVYTQHSELVALFEKK